MGKLEEKADNSSGLAGSSLAAVHCNCHLSLFQLGQDAFLKEVSVPMYTGSSKFICEVHEIPFPPLSNTVIVG